MRKALAGAVIIGTTACAEVPGETVAVERRDSAGVAIVESNGPRIDSVSAWRLSAEPEVEIGSADGSVAEAIYRVTSAVRLSDGRIVAVDGGSQEIRFFTPSGEHIRSIGRRGSGPGEFETLYRLLVIDGDTIVAADLVSRRVTFIDSAGALVRTVTLSPPDPSGGAMLLGRARDGSYYTRGGKNPMYMNLGDGRHRGAAWISRLSADGAPEGNVIEFEDGELIVADGARASLSAPFARRTPSLLAADQLIVADDESNELRFYTLKGELKRIARLSRPTRPVTGAEISEYKKRFRSGPLGERRDADKVLQFPETHPAFGEVVADSEGSIWLQEYRLRGITGPVRWSVLDASGAWLSIVEMPDRYRVTQIGSDFVLGVWLDESDVEFVRLYRLSKS